MQVYCCLGSRVKYGKALFKQVDHEFVVAAARTARLHGATSFSLVSTMGADAASKLFYTYACWGVCIASAAGSIARAVLRVAGVCLSSPLPCCRRTKGEAENDLVSVRMPRTTVLRPSLLICPRENLRVGELIMQTLVPLFFDCFMIR